MIRQAAVRLHVTLIVCILLLFAPAYVSAASGTEKVIVWGENLTDRQKQSLLQVYQVGTTEQYSVTIMSHEDEKNAFSPYLSSAMIGNQSVASVYLQTTEDDLIIHTYNVRSCTEAIYRNALLTAGVKNCEITIAAPFSISGMCAVLSAMKGYEQLTGTSISAEVQDTVIQELILTETLGEEVQDKQAMVTVMAHLKELTAASEEEPTDVQMEAWILEEAQVVDLEFTEEQTQDIEAIMKQIWTLHLDSEMLDQEPRTERTNIFGEWFRSITEMFNIR